MQDNILIDFEHGLFGLTGFFIIRLIRVIRVR